MTSSKLITKDGTKDPKAVVAFYEDFLCPACGNFERTFGPTVSKLIDSGAIAADYYMVGILDSARNDNYSSRAGAAAYCVADESIDAFRRFHTALFTKNLQPSETGSTFPDNARLIEIAREAGWWARSRLHQQRQVRAEGRRHGLGHRYSRHPDDPDQWPGLRTVNA
ncbi:thioredoxin family protein [Mycobacterium xenopi 4042]|uniref:Thioredoxin family protein n=1 Tax=Mycobacterium xenopi 4042 TaxID=1299334 RepID=X8E7S8_MYCXE|nr:thioredoxin family protein [Mycobacterium xenopi 4042]